MSRTQIISGGVGGQGMWGEVLYNCSYGGVPLIALRQKLCLGARPHAGGTSGLHHSSQKRRLPGGRDTL